MTCIRGLVEQIYFVRWVVPEVADADAIVDEVRLLHEQSGKSLRCIGIVGEEVTAPGQDVCAHFRAKIAELLRHCVSVHIVVEGKDARRAMARSIAARLLSVAENRGRTFTHDSVHQALERIGMIGPEAQEVLRSARARHLLGPTDGWQHPALRDRPSREDVWDPDPG